MRNGVVTIVPTDQLGDKIAAVVRVPGKDTATMLVNAFKWQCVPDNWKAFFINHEIGHVVLNTDSEEAANQFALQECYKDGVPLEDSIKALKWAVYNTGCNNPKQQLTQAINYACSLTNSKAMQQAVKDLFVDLSDTNGGTPGAGQGAMLTETAPILDVMINPGKTQSFIPSGAGGITQSELETDTMYQTGGWKPPSIGGFNAPILQTGSTIKDMVDIKDSGQIVRNYDFIKDQNNLPQNTGLQTLGSGAGGPAPSAQPGSNVKELVKKNRNWLLIAAVVIVVVYFATRKSN